MWEREALRDRQATGKPRCLTSTGKWMRLTLRKGTWSFNTTHSGRAKTWDTGSTDTRARSSKTGSPPLNEHIQNSGTGRAGITLTCVRVWVSALPSHLHQLDLLFSVSGKSFTGPLRNCMHIVKWQLPTSRAALWLPPTCTVGFTAGEKVTCFAQNPALWGWVRNQPCSAADKLEEQHRSRAGVWERRLSWGQPRWAPGLGFLAVQETPLSLLLQSWGLAHADGPSPFTRILLVTENLADHTEG